MRVLIAEKDPETRELIRLRLDARHYEVTAVSQSAEVFKRLGHGGWDFLVLSSDMERVEGASLIEKIRKHAHWRMLPVLLITEEKRLAEILMAEERGYDDFLTKPFNPLQLELRIQMNIHKARQRLEVNALTLLPGNHAIERVVSEKIGRREKFSVLYIDINHFKSFNDRYGFEKGDDVLRQTAAILLRTAEQAAPGEGCFIGHIGGDDFIVVLTPDYEESYARFFISEFDRIMPTYYNEDDRKRRQVRVTNRRGKLESFPLMSCAVAACNNLHRDYKSLGEISQDAAEVKAFLKSQPGSHYLRDRRGSPLRAIEEAAEILSPDRLVKKKGESVDPLGQMLLSAGLISREQLSEALKKHLETGQRLGQVLIAMNAVRSEEVGRLLEKRLRVPYVSLRRSAPSRDVLRLFTADFIESHRVVPLEAAGQTLRLAMCDPFDLKTLDAIERITRLKPVPCLALEDEFESFLADYRGMDRVGQKTG